MVGAGLWGIAVGGSSGFSRGRIVGEVVDHLGVKLLNSLGLSTASVAATRARALSAAVSLFSRVLVFLGLGGSCRLGLSLLTVNE